MTDDAPDPVLGLLSRLPEAAPPAARVEQVRARSIAMLARQRRQRPFKDHESIGTRVVDYSLFLLCFLYAAGAALEALRLASLMR